MMTFDGGRRSAPSSGSSRSRKNKRRFFAPFQNCEVGEASPALHRFRQKVVATVQSGVAGVEADAEVGAI
jgi:hypothetical protein